MCIAWGTNDVVSTPFFNQRNLHPKFPKKHRSTKSRTIGKSSKEGCLPNFDISIISYQITDPNDNHFNLLDQHPPTFDVKHHRCHSQSQAQQSHQQAHSVSFIL